MLKSRFFISHYFTGISLSKKSYIFLLTAALASRIFKFYNTSTCFLMLFSILAGEYFTLPKIHPEIKNKYGKRSLGFVESMLYYRGGHNVGSIMQVTGRIDVAKVTTALLKLMEKHPLLKAKINWPENAEAIKVSNSVILSSELPLIIEVRLDSSFSKNYLENIIDTQFNDCVPFLWQLTLAKNSNPDGPHEFIFKAHHSLFDGISVAIFMEELFYCYNGKQIFNNGNEILPFLRPTEDLLVSQTNWTRLLIKFAAETLWNIFFSEVAIDYRSHEEKTTLFSNRKTKFSFVQLNDDDLQRLLMACRNHKTTLTALIAAALLKATRETFGALIIEPISTPVNMRPYFRKEVPIGDHIGCYMADTELKLNITNDMTIWDIAKLYKEKLNVSLPVIYPSNYSATIWKCELINLVTINSKPNFPEGIGISNLGKRNFIEDKESDDYCLKLQALYFNSSQRLGRRTCSVYVLTANKQLNMCFAHTNPLIKQEQANRVIQKTLTILKEVAEYKQEIASASRLVMRSY